MNTPPDALVPNATDRTFTQARRPLEGLGVGDVILGRYRVIRRLGSGGEAEVWLCDYLPGGIQVALKAIPDPLRSSPEEMDRIRASFRLAHELHHPNIAAVKFLEEDAQSRQVYLVLEFVEGENVRELMRCRGGRMPMSEALALARQVAEGLDFAHARGVVHRDIKPENLMITPDGRVKILDFGIASAIREGMSRVSNLALLAQGTPRFMSPEQWEGRPQDGRTDQYALAMTLVMLAAGKAPFDEISGTTPLREAHLSMSPPRPEEIPEGAWGPIAKAMLKIADERYDSCRSFVEAVADAARLGPPPVPRRRWRRALLAMLVLSGLTLAGVKLWPSRENSIQPSNPTPVQVNMTITRDSGGVSLSWSSEANQLYTVLVKDLARPEARWEFLPQAINLAGTGREMTFRDQPPPGVKRNYRLTLLRIAATTPPAEKSQKPVVNDAAVSGSAVDEQVAQNSRNTAKSLLPSIEKWRDVLAATNTAYRGYAERGADGVTFRQDGEIIWPNEGSRPSAVRILALRGKDDDINIEAGDTFKRLNGLTLHVRRGGNSLCLHKYDSSKRKVVAQWEYPIEPAILDGDLYELEMRITQEGIVCKVNGSVCGIAPEPETARGYYRVGQFARGSTLVREIQFLQLD